MIDTHAHLISDDPATYPPAAARAPSPHQDPPRARTAETLLADMKSAGVERALLVQRGSIYGFDNRYVCDSAVRYPLQLAAVCAIDATASDPGSCMRHWIRERGAVGIRLMELEKGSDLSWLGASHPYPVWREAEKLDVPVCVHLFPWNRVAGLEALRQVLSALPTAQVVIDHFSNMAVQAGPPDFGVDAPLSALAEFAGVHIKFTTIPLGRLASAGVDAAPIVERVVALFGAERVMWGSDVGQSPGTYAYMVDLSRRACRRLSASQREWVLRRAAATVYRRWPAV